MKGNDNIKHQKRTTSLKKNEPLLRVLRSLTLTVIALARHDLWCSWDLLAQKNETKKKADRLCMSDILLLCALRYWWFYRTSFLLCGTEVGKIHAVANDELVYFAHTLSISAGRIMCVCVPTQPCYMWEFTYKGNVILLHASWKTRWIRDEHTS